VGRSRSARADRDTSKGAFAGQNVSVIAILDLGAADFAAACNTASGLTTLAFTGVQADSTLVSP